MLYQNQLVLDYLENRNEEKLLQELSAQNETVFHQVLNEIFNKLKINAVPLMVRVLREVKDSFKPMVRDIIKSFTESFYYQCFQAENLTKNRLTNFCPCKKLPFEIARIAGIPYFKTERNKWWHNL